MTDPELTFRRLKSLVACGLIVTLAGCENLGAMMPDFEESRPTPKRLQLQVVDHSHSVAFPETRADLLVAEAEKLNTFLYRRARAARYTVFVMADKTTPAVLADERGDTVAAYLESQGYHTRLLPAGNEPGAARVRVVVRSYSVSLPGCPDWTGNPSHNFDNTVHSNWGCANETSLGLMVADPGDLGRGRDAGPADGELLSKRIRDYRKGETKPLDPEDIGTIESQQKTGSGGGAE